MYKDIINNYIEGAYLYKPIWLMRQAGRYLPEYLAIRKNVNGFLDLCYTPELSKEVTLQPIKRFDFDAAILFSDILVIPHALGQDLWFVEQEGPKLNTEQLADILAKPFDEQQLLKHLEPVFEAISMIRSDLQKEKTLIGFAGAPWTLAAYMIEGGSSKDYQKARLFAYQHPIEFARLIDILTKAIICFIEKQFDAGVNIAKVFDSWAGFIPPALLDVALIEPYKKIQNHFKKQHRKIIFFPKGCTLFLPKIIQQTNIQIVSIDHYQDMNMIYDYVGKANMIYQGNLDPFLLKAGGSLLDDTIDNLLEYNKSKHIINLGHGIDKDTPIDHVYQLCERRKKYYGMG